MTITGAVKAPQLKKRNPLLNFTLQGQAQELDEMAVAQTPLLGDICLSGQGTVICAPPNAGKTLITLALLIEAIEAKRIAGDDVFYVDADDTTQGVADKVRLLDEYGVHVVAEGYKGFRAGLLIGALEQMILDGTSRGKFLILDTFKKFTSPMSKADTSRFTEVIRRFVLAGGTLLCLSHTNKNVDAQGKNVFAGVSDIIDDLDCAYVIDVKQRDDGKRLVLLTNRKRRGNNPDVAAYTYAPEASLNYLERLVSVTETDDIGDELGEGPRDERTTDADIIESIVLAIQHGTNRGKMELVRIVAEQGRVSKRRVLLLLEQFTGEDPAAHRWRYVVRARGLHVFELLTKAE